MWLARRAVASLTVIMMHIMKLLALRPVHCKPAAVALVEVRVRVRRIDHEWHGRLCVSGRAAAIDDDRLVDFGAKELSRG